MATNDQNEFGLPTSKSDTRTTASLIPRFYRTDSNKKFLQSTLDQLTQPGTVKKTNGYIGRQNAKSVTSSDIFVEASDQNRQNYQLEPVAIIQDFLGNTNFYKDYIDHVNHVDVFGGNTKNHERLNKQEFYSWNPHICWDKFVNYQQYYWLPYGPTPVDVAGQAQEIESTYTVSSVDEGDNYAFLFTPDGLTRNPTLTLYRGQTYKFEINSPGNPFSIKTIRTPGDLDRYTQGVSANGVTDGVITFTITESTPDVLYYVSENSVDTGGVFHILDVKENTYLNVDSDIIGKKTYTLSNGISLSNGMKLKFTGKVEPAQYEQGYWYVEGVGSQIKLISETDLDIISNYTEEQSLLFDDEPFDKSPFSTATSFPQKKDYIVINRSSPDRNQWARYNRWFHQDVIKASAEASGNVPEYDQTARAIRPIIEFNAGLKLYNFGHESKANVDVIDTFTTDVFSIIEGSLGYNVDGIDLANGMRVLFTADPDSLVKNRIFKVNFINVTAPGRIVNFNPLVDIDYNSAIITSPGHGFTTGNQVLYLNNDRLSVPGLVNRKSYYVYVVDADRIILYTDKNLTVAVTIFSGADGTHGLELFAGLRRQINLVEEPDGEPLLNETVLVNQGTINQGLMYWYNGETWKLGQTKTVLNQPPLFDVFDASGNSYGDLSIYDGSTFNGTKVFSYKIGTGSNDTELGFPLSYQNINNIGDIVFNFDLLSDTFNYKQVADIITKGTDVGFLKSVISLASYNYENGWITSQIKNAQPIVRIFKESGLVNNFPIDVYDNVDNLEDLEVRVYINGKRLANTNYTVETGIIRKSVVLNSDVLLTDVVTLKCFAKQSKNKNGYYEIPISLQNNPLNDSLSTFTLGQVIDHVDSIVDNISDKFTGVFPGNNNLRDLGNLSTYGTRFVQHSGPVNLSLYHLGSLTSNAFKAMDKAREDYGRFKRAFIVAASTLGVDMDPKRHVDYILSYIAEDKSKTQAYYTSDMFGFSGNTRLEYEVLDSRIKTYPLTSPFSLEVLSNKAVSIYLNGDQLLHGRDYTFSTDAFFILTDSVNLVEGDMIEAYEYETTDGSFCPATPTKLGLYPLYEPSIYLDTTYLEPTMVIQGHDGSITIAYNDFRDDLILELEKRIFNNIKVKYDPSIFNIFDFVPGYERATPYSKEEFEKTLSQFFFQWTSNITQDYTKQIYYNRLDPFTFNYRENYAPDGTSVPAFWRGIYKWFLDTDRPHTHPWESLGFSIKPKWWDEVYGEAPYTSNNFLLWEDLKDGIVREPGKPVRRLEKFARSILGRGVPVTDSGDLENPILANFVEGYIKEGEEGYFIFGDQSPVEAAWRKSGYYPFALIQTALLLQPNRVLGTCLDRSRIVKNLSDQLVYSTTGLRIRLKDIILPSTSLSSSRTFASGIINYVVDLLTSDTNVLVDQYQEDLQNLTNRIGSKLGGFTSKSKFKLLLDSKNPTSTGGIFVPEENYSIFLNTSSPIKKLVYSGVVITKYPDGFELRGYNNDDPYFKYYPWKISDRSINVGGISENYVIWETGKYYVAGKIVAFSNQYYRVKTSHTSTDTFNDGYFTRLPFLPIVGGRTALIRQEWDTSEELTIAYGTKIADIQEVVDFLQGYGAYLTEQGFVFDDYNTNLKVVNNWETAVKEFLFWTTQNWAEGAVLSLSPAADRLILKTTNAVVNNIRDEFYGYKIFRVDGQKLEPEFTNAYRAANEFNLSPQNTKHGIFGAVVYLVQKEHAVIIDNRTLFNDVIYDLEPGYRQEKIKVLGYLSKNWNGGFNIPGFIYDQAYLNDWAPWTDYKLGDIVKYKEFYYTANTSIPGTETFDAEKWTLQTNKPVSSMKANWDYQSEQFTDFYDLDTDNFNAEQQKFAQHIIGYQKRQYLENIIKDDVSQYKFYQGMIIEKGTQNVLNKLFDVLSADNQESLTFNEEWAVRVGNYGATTGFEEIEFILDEGQFKLKPQPIELVNTIDPTVFDFVYRQRPSDVYLKPVGYDNNPWPVGADRFLRTPGYVRYEDVKLNLDTISNVVAYDISTFIEGDYVWCAFEGRDWNIYRFTKTAFKVEDAEYTANTTTLTLQTDLPHGMVAGDIIGIENSDLIKGFHVIDSVSIRKINIKIKINGWEKFADSSQVLTYKFTTSRTINIDNANDILPFDLKTRELIWTDNNGLNKWSVYVNSKVYSSVEVDRNSGLNLNFGKKVSITGDGNTASITDSNNVKIYSRTTLSEVWREYQIILQDPAISNTPGFGAETCFSADGRWLAVAEPTANTNRGYVSLYYRDSSSTYVYAGYIQSPSPAINELFGSKLAFAKSGSVYTLAVSATGYNSNAGRVYFYTTSSNTWAYLNATNPGVSSANDRFGYDIAFSGDGSVFVASAPFSDSEAGSVLVYNKSGTSYALIDTIEFTRVLPAGFAPISQGDRFGSSVALTTSGNYLAVGSTLTTDTISNQGRVIVFEIDSGVTAYQEIYSPRKEANEYYGSDVKFMNDDETLVVFSTNGDIDNWATFDGELTTFDNSTLKLVDVIVDTGRIDIYDRYNTKFVFGESLASTSAIQDNYGYSIAVAKNTILVGAPTASDAFEKSGKIFAYAKPSGATSWEVLHEETERPNTSKIKKAFLYNRNSNQLVSYLDVVDPIQGKIPGLADQEIRYKTFYDPATYSVGTSEVNVDDGMNWTKPQTGMLWWDLTKAKFLENLGGSVVFRSTTWNTLYETASIDIYEWVETKYLPSEWDKLADTEKGLAQGISGKSRYGDSVYSVKQKYDTASKKFINTYYFWVKGKTLVPNVSGRTLSAAEVASLIADPVAYGYPCIALTGSNSFSLVNVENLITDKDVVLSVQYWIIDNQENNTHSQWKVISNHPNTSIPKNIEDKWIHSLIGKDDSDRTIPDFSLPVKLRYGVEFRPRQGMFINRVEALKQYIERVNEVLSTSLIVDDYDISSLNSLDPEPSTVSGVWDVRIDTDEELKFVGTANFVQAQLTPVVVNGKIVDVNIVNPGNAYVNAPYIKVAGTGTDAVLQAVLDTAGKVSSVNIINSGTGYDSTTMLSIRPFAVLVGSDTSTFDKWCIYQWNATSRTWIKSKSQSYNVTKFWDYIDWYATGYNQFTKIDYVVDNTYQLVMLESPVGSIVKVKNVGAGGWLLLEKYNSSITIDYTQNYKVIGRQDGTIKFLSSLYDFKTSIIGFDNQLFDGDLYDNFAVTELRIIIDTIKNKILVDDLRVEYLNLFFASLRYALHEQPFVDWAFKTSFVKATHNVGDLKQKVTYNNDNLENFEDYINEVKPFRTKVREYVSLYSKTDPAQMSVTDFDLLPVIDQELRITPISATVSDTGEITYSSPSMQTYPWKHWYDNVGFTIQSIEIVDGGSGYIGRPVVRIEGGYGSGAIAKAYISNGRVNRIELISGGTGYLKAPTIVIDGGLSETGTAATAVAVIESEVVRSNKITIKFDRITRTYFVTELAVEESFVGTGSRLQFPLRWSPCLEIGKSSVSINGTDILRSEYTIVPKKSTTRGYTSYYGSLTLASAPALNDVITIKYEKNFNHLSAADRINFYYNPTTGQLGKDLAQLMNGIDYGGVQLTGLGFKTSGGWDELPWFTDAWDGYDGESGSWSITVADSTYVYTLPYVPDAGEEINIYLNGVRIDDPDFGTPQQTNANAVMLTWVGDGITNVIELPNLTSPVPLDINAGDKVTFIKASSDGSVLPNANEYDTQLSGGAFVGTVLTSATGYAPDDINVDGDGFVTPMTSHAPEEIVPGQILDAVAIKVYHRPRGGAPKIIFKNHIADGVNDTFTIGQYFETNRSVIVKVNNLLLEEDQYTVDWPNNSIVLDSVPSNKSIVSIASVGFNSVSMLDLDYFIADGSTVEFITRAPWVDNLVSTVLVDGFVVEYELFRADAGYESPECVGIRFGEAVNPGSIVNYLIDVDTDGIQNSSVVKSQTILFDGSTRTYNLTNLNAGILPGQGLKPYETNVLVRKGQEILRPPRVEYFTMSNSNLLYTIPYHKFAPYTLNVTDIEVYAEGEKLTQGPDYIVDMAGITIELSNLVYTEGGSLAVVVKIGHDYLINDNGTITFLAEPAYAENTEIEVISFYNHTILEVERTTDLLTPSVALVPDSVNYFEFTNKLGGRFKLNRTAIDDSYAWVIKNGNLLTPSVDYLLEDDHLTVSLKDPLIATDVIQVMSFSGDIVKAPFAYMQFKDMLNRVHYKRLNRSKSTRLAKDLLQTDITIEVLDGSVLTDPNPSKNLPGIIEINGERIEYFIKTGNVLGHLRRGTLGTGTPTVHVQGRIVIDIGISETIPYNDSTQVITAIADGSTNVINLELVPMADVIAAGHDYNSALEWASSYLSGFTTTIPNTQIQADDIDVFVGGYRLKKVPYRMFEESNGYPDSTEGDSQFDAEFSVTGNTGAVTITEAVAQKFFGTNEIPQNTKITVVKKTGELWGEFGKSLIDSSTEIANFITSVEPIWPQYLEDKYDNNS